MSESSDPLERELSAVHPRAVSPDLRRSVGEQLAAPQTGRRWVWDAALAGVLAVGGVLVLVVPWRKTPVPPEVPVVVPAPPAANTTEEFVPTLIVYQRALARSPEDLDALLARAAPAGGAEPLTRSTSNFDALIGDK